jgi:hypothetical protein
MLVIDIQLGTYAQKLAYEGPVPRILIIDMMIQVCIDLRNGKKTRRVKISRDACECLGRNVEGDGAANNGMAVLNSMLKFFLGKVFGRVM